MLKKKKTTASGKLVLVKSVRRTRSHRMKFCVQRGLGALPSTSKRRGKSRRDFLLCGPVCINTGIACRFLCRNEKSQRGNRQISLTGSIRFKFLGQLCQFFHRFLGVMQQGVTHFWRTAGIKHFHLIDTFIFQRNIWIYKRI